MKGRGQEGAITVFLSIILLIMITLAGVIVDAARVNIAGPQIQRAVETSVRSSLAGYYKPLKEQYGLFALNENGEERLKETIEEYINKNLMINKEYLDEDKIGKYVDLYDYEIESISVEPIFNLTENPVTRQQILEYMKYRAPKDLVEEFIDKLKMFKRAGTTSEIYERKVNLDKKMKKVENIQRDIYKNVYGESETYRFLFWEFERPMKYFVRGLSKGECSSKINNYVGTIYSYKSLKEKLEEATDDEEKESLRLGISYIKSYMRKRFNEFHEDMSKYIEVNEAAKTKIGELRKNTEGLREELDGFKGDLRKDKDDIIDGVFNQLNSEVEQNKKLLLDVEKGKDGLKENNFEKIIKDLDENEKLLLDAKNLLNEISPSQAQRIAIENLYRDNLDEVDGIKEDIRKKLEEYEENIEYDYKLDGKEKEKYRGYEEYDRRENSENEAKKRIETQGDDQSICNNDHKSLPSTIKLQRDTEDKYSYLEFLWKDDYGKPKGEKIEEVEFHRQESLGFGESSLSFLGKITKAMDPKNIRDEIYINEYIMGMFKNYVTEFDEEEKYNLRNEEKFAQASYFDTSEVEYILNGKRSEKANQTLTDSKILLTRFCLNSIHAFLCEEKNKIVGGTATVVAGAFTGGAGIPIIKTLILLGWSMGEAIYDLDELKEGREIALYKTEEDWVTDLKGGNNSSSKIKQDKDAGEKSSTKKKNPMDTSYQDYLRFFLIVQDDDLTMTRLQDLIQLNMQKATENKELRLEGLNTYIRVEAVVSIKYLFLTQSFIPEEFKTKGNRHKFKVEIYQGY